MFKNDDEANRLLSKKPEQLPGCATALNCLFKNLQGERKPSVPDMWNDEKIFSKRQEHLNWDKNNPRGGEVNVYDFLCVRCKIDKLTG